MRRAHRSIHRAIWPVLALAVGIGLFMAMTLRKAPARDWPGAAIQVNVQ
jgi:hypothetical protein